MKINIGWLIFFSLLAGFLVWLYEEYLKDPIQTVTIQPRKDYDLVTLRLPNSKDADVFGSKYWDAFHSLANNIPCGICRNDAVPMMVFMHDVVNKKLGKKLFDAKNFEEFKRRINEEKQKS